MRCGTVRYCAVQYDPSSLRYGGGTMSMWFAEVHTENDTLGCAMMRCSTMRYAVGTVRYDADTVTVRYDVEGQVLFSLGSPFQHVDVFPCSVFLFF
jgi:hypothetical protein